MERGGSGENWFVQRALGVRNEKIGNGMTSMANI